MATLPNIGRAEAVLAAKTAAGRRDRLNVTQAAQLSAITRHAPKTATVQANTDHERCIDRTEAHDLHVWSD